MAAEIVRLLVEKGRRVLWLTHREELFDQSVAVLEERLSERVEFIKAGRPTRGESMVHVAGVQTVWSRGLSADYSAVVIDECHLAYFERVLGSFCGYKLGLTATPTRLDGKGLGDDYKSIVIAAKPSELLIDGQILRDRTFPPHVTDTKSLRKNKGE